MSFGIPERFHIHIDAETIDPRLSSALLDSRGFSEKNFIREGQRGSEYSPHVHVTQKYWDKASFDKDFDFVLAQIGAGAELKGYVEGEYIALNRQFQYKPRQNAVAAPFKLALGQLPEGTFRQTELHLTVSQEESDPAVLEALFDMGFFCAYAPKSYGMAQVFTVQGSYRNIAEIIPLLTGFIEEGGLAHVRLKEERIVRSWVSSASIVLPPIVEEIEVLAGDAGQMRSRESILVEGA
jgi:hypothetical protein